MNVASCTRGQAVQATVVCSVWHRLCQSNWWTHSGVFVTYGPTVAWNPVHPVTQFINTRWWYKSILNKLLNNSLLIWLSTQKHLKGWFKGYPTIFRHTDVVNDNIQHLLHFQTVSPGCYSLCCSEGCQCHWWSLNWHPRCLLIYTPVPQTIYLHTDWKSSF